MAHYEPSYQDLHCLPFCSDFWLTSPFATIGMSEFSEGRADFINPGCKGLKRLQFTGGEDPGVSLTRRIFTISQGDSPPEVIMEHHDGCQYSHGLTIFYNTKSYQDKLYINVQTSGNICCFLNCLHDYTNIITNPIYGSLRNIEEIRKRKKTKQDWFDWFIKKCNKPIASLMPPLPHH